MTYRLQVGCGARKGEIDELLTDLAMTTLIDCFGILLARFQSGYTEATT